MMTYGFLFVSTNATPAIVTSTPVHATGPSISSNINHAMTAVAGGVRYIKLVTSVARPRRIITSSSVIANSERATIDHTSASQNSGVKSTTIDSVAMANGNSTTNDAAN